jgi:MSHA biogenesis protein MshJ
MLFQVLVFDVLIAEQSKLTRQEAELKKQIDQARVSTAQVIAESVYDPNKPVLEKIEQAKQQSELYLKEISTITDKLIAPAQMSDVMASLLNKESGLKLTSVKTIAAEPISIGENAGAQLYKHQIKMELEGKYSQVADYLSRVESMPQRVFWYNLEFQMENYPIGRLSLDVYTLSTSKDLIGVYQ